MLHTKLVPAGQLRKSWLAVATVLLLLVGMAFVACKDDSGETPPAGSSDDTQTGGDSSSNPFIGTWTGTATLDGESASATVTVTESGWTIVCSDAGMNESGTYSRTGNTATLTQSGTTFGRASISGSTLTVSITSGDYQGGSGTFTKTGGDSSSNPFIGTWTGTATLDGESASATVTVTESGWTFVCSDAGMNESGTYSRTGNTATLTQNGTTFGSASISGSTLTVSITSGDYQGGSGTFRK